jgi:hypothetical protein
LVVEWEGLGCLFSSTADADGVFLAVEGADATKLDKFRATSLMACQRYLAGKLSLHGSAVALPSGAIVLIGDRGAGKSTTAMALTERLGAAFLADDIVPVDWEGPDPVVQPVQDSFWLANDASAWFGLQASSTEKRPFPPRNRAGKPERLKAVVHLDFDEALLDDVDLQPMRGHEAFVALSLAHVCFPQGRDDDALRNLEARFEFVRHTQLLKLRRRRSLKTVNRACDILAQRLGALP